MNKNALGNYLSSSIGGRLLATSDFISLSVQPTKITAISYDSDTELLTTNVDYYANVRFADATLNTYPSNSSESGYFYSTPVTNTVFP